jgi:hypothetical protein
MDAKLTIRPATASDDDAIWGILQPTFRAMQFNFVIAANERAVRLWQASSFAIIDCLPQAFQHPRLGMVDALVMVRVL